MTNTAQISAEQLIQKATLRQNNAADGQQSVWVSASAGTGKTYVLTKRILGLLLKDETLKPREILAVTFTNAAAREMAERLRSELSHWATCDSQTLTSELQKILTSPPTSDHIKRARMLFAEFLDYAVETNTIHGLCQKILAQFPLEADISPNFQLVEGQDRETLLVRAKSAVFAKALDGTLQNAWAFDYFAYMYSENALGTALDYFVGNATRFRRYLSRHGGMAGVQKQLAGFLNINPLMNLADYETEERRLKKVPIGAANWMKKAAEALMQGGQKAQGHGVQFQAFVANPQSWDLLKEALYTQSGTPKKSLADKKAKEFGGEAIWQDIDTLQQEVIAVEDKISALHAYLSTLSFLELGAQILTQYENIKQKTASLDFDDLIAKTSALLKNSEKSEWVRFRLDQKIRHVLLDEAQDTDSDQWHIINAIVDEFYMGDGQHQAGGRTFFAVGDLKQSIYRFRGAEPHVFGAMRTYLEGHANQGGYPVAVEELMVSFRSTEPVLTFVDQVFASPERHQAVDDMADKIQHNAVQVGSSGVVHVLPLLEKEKAEKSTTTWALPSAENAEDLDLDKQIAQQTAQQILTWLNSADVLQSTGQHIQPGDIMILLRSRSLMNALIEALDQHYIPHSGADEVTLQAETVVKDMLALLKFMAEPQDSLALAHVLRSPLFALDDEMFDNLFANKPKQIPLWQVVDKTKAYGAELKQLRRVFLKESLQSFITHVLAVKNVRGVYYGLLSVAKQKAVVSAVDDALDTLLNLAMEVSKKGEGVLTYIHKLDTQMLRLNREADVGNRVRIMTAHKSKGLESPIVILPDTTGDFYKNISKETGLWQTEADGADTLFLYRKAKKEAPAVQETLENMERERVFRDEMRLLYVALTRAKERLYISGVRKHGYKPENTWYGNVLSVVEKAENFNQLSAGEFLYSVSNNLTAQSTQTPLQTVEAALPSWAENLAAAEHGLTLTHASDSLKRKEQINQMTSNQSEVKLFKRGKIVHRLLEFLPQYPAEERSERGLRFLAQMSGDFSSAEQQELLKSALLTMASEAQFFGANSKAETPIAATIGQARLEGVIDRLVVEENCVIAVDYKTNKKVPDDVPLEYLSQMNLYKKALAQIFPNKEIKAAIIWTSAKVPRVDWL